MTAAVRGSVELHTVGTLRIAIGHPEDLGLVSHATSPRTTQEVVRELGDKLLVAVDGPMFEYCASERNRTYERYECGALRFAHYYPARGLDVPSREPAKGGAVYVAGGRAYGTTTAGGRIPGETFRVQGYPTLVVNGVATAGLTDVDTNKRPAIGILSDGRVFLACASSITMPDLARTLGNFATPSGARVEWAFYLDGGGSAAMYVDVNLDGRPEYNFNLGGRRVVTWVTLEKKSAVLAALPSPVQATLARVGSLGPLGYVLAATAALAAAVGVYIAVKD